MGGQGRPQNGPRNTRFCQTDFVKKWLEIVKDSVGSSFSWSHTSFLVPHFRSVSIEAADVRGVSWRAYSVLIQYVSLGSHSSVSLPLAHLL